MRSSILLILFALLFSSTGCVTASKRLPASRDEIKSLPTLNGFIWIGRKFSNDRYMNVTIGDSQESDVKDIANIKPGTQFHARNNLFARQGLPSNTPAYFRLIPVAGLIEVGDTVELIEKPVTVVRGENVDYWALVKFFAKPAVEPESVPN